MKKLFAILMSIMMIACFMPTMAFAAEADPKVEVENGKITGSKGTEFSESQTVTITLTEKTFADTLTDTDGWITNLPAGLKQKATLKATEETVDEKAGTEKKIAIITISGTPNEVSEKQIAIKIPKESLSGGETADLEIALTDNAKFEILSEVEVPTAKALTYNGQKQPAFETNEAYTLGGTYEETNVGASAYEATITLKEGYRWKAGDNRSEEKKINWNIKKKTPEASDFTFTPPSGEMKYVEGQAKTAKVAFNSGKYQDSNDILSVKYYVDNKEKESATDAATYTVKVNVAGTGNFEAKDGVTDEEGSTWTFEIAKADQAAPTGLTGARPESKDGQGKITGTTEAMEYSTDQSFANPAGATCGANETAVTPGNYYVRYKADNNHNPGTASNKITVPAYSDPVTPPAETEIPTEVMNAIKAYTDTYDGNEHDAITGLPAEKDGYTVQYKVGDGAYSDNMPKVKNVADKPKITVKVSKGNASKETKALTPSITAKGVTYTIQLEGKTYDGTTSLTKVKLKAGTTPTITGVAASDKNDVNLDLSKAIARFSDSENGTDAGNDKKVEIKDAALTGAVAANYKLTTVTATASINKAKLSITGVKIANKEYDDSMDATVQSLTFTGLVGNEELSKDSDYTAGAYFFDGPDAGTDKEVIVEVDLKANGRVAKNYVLDLKGEDVITAKATITKATKKAGLTAAVTVKKGTYGFVDIHEEIEVDGRIGEISVPEDKAGFFAADKKPRVNERGLLEFTLSDTASNTVEIKVPVKNARNYNDYEITVTVTVSETEQVNVSAPRALNRVYDGTTKPLVEAGKLSSEKYKLQYAVDNGEFEFDIPTAKDVKNSEPGESGTVTPQPYTVKYRVINVGTDGTVTVVKADNTFTPIRVTIYRQGVTYFPKNVTITQGSELPTPVLMWSEISSADTTTTLRDSLKAFAEKAKFAYQDVDGKVIDKSAAPGEYRIVCTNTKDFVYNDYNYDVYHGEGILTINKNSGSSGSYYPYTPSTPSKPAAPNLDKTKTDSTTALNAAATANKYDAAEQAEVKKILDKANADIKNAKTEVEVKAIEEAAQAEIDKILTTEEKATVAALDNVEKRDFETKSKVITRKSGKKVIRLTWTAPDGVDVDGYEIFRSTKKNSGFGTKPYFETTNTSYTNTKNLKPGKIYYYKVRAFVVINGERVYTDYSMKAFRTIK